MPNKARRSRAQWSALIEEYRKSDETERAFCRRHDLNMTTFRNWKYRQGSAPVRRPTKAVAERSNFVEVITAPRDQAPVRIRLGDELSIDCPRDMSIDEVARLASALHHGR